MLLHLLLKVQGQLRSCLDDLLSMSTAMGPHLETAMQAHRQLPVQHISGMFLHVLLNVQGQLRSYLAFMMCFN